MLKSGPENIPQYICQQKKFTDLTFDLNTSYTSGQFGPQLRYYLYGDYYKNETYVKRWGQGEFFPSNGTVQYGGNSTSRGGGNITDLMLGSTKNLSIMTFEYWSYLNR